MTKASTTTASTVSTPQQRFDTLIDRVDKLYKVKMHDQSPEIKKDLQRQFDNLQADAANPGKLKEFLDLAEDIFDERRAALVRRKNVVRQLGEIDDIQLNPEKAKIRQHLDEKYRIDQDATIDQIKNYDHSMVHIKVPSRNYRQNVMFAGLETQDMVDMNFARLQSLRDDGCDIADKEKESLKKRRSHNVALKEGVARAVGAVHSVIQRVGDGIWSEQQAVDSSYAREYSHKKDQLLQDLRSRIDPNCSNYSQLLNRIISKLSSSSDALDIASFEQIKESLLKEIVEYEKGYKERIDKFDKDIGDAHNAMLDDVQKYTDNASSMAVSRLISLGMILTPLGAFSVAGHVFNYLEPLSHIFGPIFEANKSLGEGFGDAITSKEFGFLGQLMDKMEVDKAVEIVFDKTPLFSQFTEVINYFTDSDIAQGLMAEAAPLIGSPLLLAGIAGSYSINRAPAELAHSRNKKDVHRKHNKVQEVLFENLYRELEKGWVAKDANGKDVIRNGSNESLAIMAGNYIDFQQKAAIDVRVCSFFCENFHKLEMAAVLKTISKELFDEFSKGTFADDRDPQKLSPQKMIKFLSQNDQTAQSIRDKAYQQFLLLGAIDENLINKGALSGQVSNTLDQFIRLSEASVKAEADEKRKTAREKFDQQFYFDQADYYKIPCQRTKEGAEIIAKTLKSRMADEWKKEVTGVETPRTWFQPTNDSVQALGGNAIAQGM